MSSKNESMKKVVTVAVLLCLACSVVVSSAAVLLRDKQQANQARDMKRNILLAGNMLDPTRGIEEQFSAVATRVVDLETGEFTDAVDPDTYDPRRAARDPQLSTRLARDQDVAGINRRERYALVYLVQDEQGGIEKLILPVRGYGLWSTMHGFLALESDLNTIAGISFYEHGETPGLGGEIDNPRWQANWEGKRLFGEGDPLSPALTVVKGDVDPDREDAVHRVDGLSGATLTARGVDKMIQFWLGADFGYARFLSNLRSGEA